MQRKVNRTRVVVPSVVALVLQLAPVGHMTVHARAADDPATRPAGGRPAFVVKTRVTQSPDAKFRGGAVRGTADGRPYVLVLAPRKVADAVTTLEQPTVYWYLSQEVRHPVEVSVNVPAEQRTLFVKGLKGAKKAGVHAFDLAAEADDRGRRVRLEPGVRYEVVVSLRSNRADDAAADSVGILPLERVPIDGPLAAAAAAAPDPYARAVAYAAGGVWCDALAALSAAIKAAPNDAELRNARATMLNDQGIVEAPDGRITLADGKAPGHDHAK